VFRDPEELFRKIGASQKNDGPVSDDVRFNLTFHQTRWSELEGGRVYRHDVRAMQAYQHDARESLDHWHSWDRIRCPVLLIHGLRSDALLQPTIQRMARARTVKIMHVPDTGHTPVLADRNQIWFIGEWLRENDHVAQEWSVLHAPSREPFPGAQVPFAPDSALR
jgi:pimeloyl-ACP methyl ester carboxylesterase